MALDRPETGHPTTVRSVDPRTVPRAARRAGQGLARRVLTEADRLASRRGRADLAIFHEFAPPPGGGGHQFLRALERELTGRGLDVERNRVSGGTPACLFNSFNFDFVRLRRFSRTGCRMAHRVDGPIGVYRGFDDGTDRRIAEINLELADATVFQSRFSLEKHVELGFELREPAVISNAVDPAIFHPPEQRDPLDGRKVRLIATSWSDNLRKGGETLAWLDRNLDWDRYELTFVGRSSVPFERIRTVGPVGSVDVAELLRGHDAYVAASRDDPCSNALLEALACGLPAAFRESGGHPELVGGGGVSFRVDEEIPDVLERMVERLDGFREAISVPSIGSVADRYLQVLGLAS
jgi:glycosyltransferase involved in cell wall biosynthesis